MKRYHREEKALFVGIKCMLYIYILIPVATKRQPMKNDVWQKPNINTGSNKSQVVAGSIQQDFFRIQTSFYVLKK